MPTQTQSLSRQTSQVFSQRKALSEVSLTPTASSQRTPFRDISYTESDFDVPDSPSNNGRRRRLIKGSRPADEGQMLPPPPVLSASFQLEPKKKVKLPKEKRPAKSEFIEGEAEESDEEKNFGFIREKDEEEDDDDEAQDKSLATLVDDKEMNEEEVNREAVLEKVKYVADLIWWCSFVVYLFCFTGNMRRRMINS